MVVDIETPSIRDVSLSVVFALFAFAAGSACGSLLDSNGESDESNSSETSEANPDESELPGEPRPNKPGRIKEGMHIRPNLDWVVVSPSDAERYVELGEKGPITHKYAYLTGPVREEVADLEQGDLLIAENVDFIFLLGSEREETDRGLKVGLRQFELSKVVWGKWKRQLQPRRLPVDSATETPSEEWTPPEKTEYRTKQEHLGFNENLPRLDLDLVALGPFSAALRIRQGSTLKFRPHFDVIPTFEGRIPFIAEDHQCDPPDYTAQLCGPGGFICSDEYEFCVEKIGIEFEAGLAMWGNMGLRAEGQLQFYDQGWWDWVAKRSFYTSLPPPLSAFGVEAIPYAEVESDMTVSGGWAIDVEKFGGTIGLRMGFMYEDGEGADGIFELSQDAGPDCPGCPDSGAMDIADVKKQARFFSRTSLEFGLRWSMTTLVTNNNSPGIARFELLETAMETRRDTAYRTWPYPDKANSCLWAGLFTNPLIEMPSEKGPIFRAGVDLPAFGEKTFEIPIGFGRYKIAWRADTGIWPIEWPVGQFRGEGQFCLGEDADNDGCPDSIDPDPEVADEDGDGCLCGEELYVTGTDPEDPDTNDDGVSDGLQCQNNDPSSEPSDTEKPFKVEASWRNTTDVDLHVIGPDGTELGPNNRSGGGGEYLFDVCGENDDDCSDVGTNTETIVFEPDSARGQYELWVTNADGGDAVPVRLRTRRGKQTTFYKEIQLDGQQGASSNQYPATY